MVGVNKCRIHQPKYVRDFFSGFRSWAVRCAAVFEGIFLQESPFNLHWIGGWPPIETGRCKTASSTISIGDCLECKVGDVYRLRSWETRTSPARRVMCNTSGPLADAFSLQPSAFILPCLVGCSCVLISASSHFETKISRKRQAGRNMSLGHMTPLQEFTS